MSTDDHRERLFTIGEFSRLSSISVRMLRHYDEHGVLSPVRVDTYTGYRYYAPSQLPSAQRVRQLRDVGFGVATIAGLMTDVGNSGVLVRALEAQHGQLASELTKAQARLRTLAALLQSTKGSPMSTEITQVTIPAHTVVTLRDRIPTYADEGQLWERLMTLLPSDGVCHFDTTMPCGAIFYDDDHVENDPDVEIFEPVTSLLEVTVPAQCRQMPEMTVLKATHQGPYDTIPTTISELGEALGEKGLRSSGPMFNRYLANPTTHPDNPDAWVTEICIPIKA